MISITQFFGYTSRTTDDFLPRCFNEDLFVPESNSKLKKYEFAWYHSNENCHRHINSSLSLLDIEKGYKIAMDCRDSWKKKKM